MMAVAVCFVIPQRKICVFYNPLNKVNKQHGRLLITYNVQFNHDTASQPSVVGVVIDVLNVNEYIIACKNGI